MLIAFLLVLSAVKVHCEAADQDGLRKSRQLDLGLQDIRVPDEKTPTTVRLPSSKKDEVINGYLPPASSSLSPEVTGAQSQQTFDFKSVNSVEKESDLCKPPFDQESCDFKDISTLDSKIPKPSRDLVPPLNDLEQELFNKAATVFEQTKEEIGTTLDSQTTFPTTITTTTTATTTTAKTEVKFIEPAPTQNIDNIIKSTTRPRPVSSTAEATNELRSYLPPQPEFSGAAQTNVAVVQPASQDNHDHDHHHHHQHHHHDENFNICDDAFHAFLCAPLKARKRITGALPSSLKGQSSFIKYQKTLPNSDRETASSNTFRNEYLPPRPSSTNKVQSTYLPPFTKKRPIVSTTTTSTTTTRPYSFRKFGPEPSNSKERFYLPPLPGNASPVKPAPSNQAFSTIRSTAVSPINFGVSSRTTSSPVQNSFFQSMSPTLPVFNSLSSNENNFYLPPNSNPQYTASFTSNSQNIFPIISTVSPVSSTFAPLPSVFSFVPSPSNSVFLPQKPAVQPTVPVFTTTKSPAFVEKLNSFPTASSIFPSALPTFATTSKPSNHRNQVSSFSPQPSSYLPPISEFRSSSNPSTTTARPFSESFKYSEQSSNTDRSYLPPDPNEPAAAQISSAAVAPPQVKNPFHHGRDLCTDPFHSFLCTSAKPRKRITGQLPSGYRPESSNTNELRLKPESSNKDERPLEEAPAQNVGYKYPKPVNSFPTPSNAISSTLAPSTGYSYPKPDKVFPLPSQQDFRIATSSTTKKPEPIFRTSEARVSSGYQYPKPDKISPSPGGQDSNKVITTTSSPTTGYSYPTPQKSFPLPTEQKEVRQKPKISPTRDLSLPTNTVKGYEYPKPDQGLKLPEKKGYSYPKPEKRLELPTEARNRTLPQSSNLDPLGNLGSADFIPVNKIEFKRAESSKLLAGLRRFGERMKKRERESQLYKKN